MNDRGVGRNFNFGNNFKVALRWWECDYVIVLWVLIVELRRSFEFGVFQRELLKSEFGDLGMTARWGKLQSLGIISKLP